MLKFVHCLRSQARDTAPLAPPKTLLTTGDVDQARLHWIKDSQSHMQRNGRFPSWRCQLDLFNDESGVCGRTSKSSLSPAAKTPILLDKEHHLTTSIVMDAHRCVMHGGVRETLAELRSAYWLVQGRQFIRKLIHGCVVCRKHEGRLCQGHPPPPLPEHRVRQSQPFQTTGVDFAGPLHVKISNATGSSKVWLCLYTCCTTRAVHLDLVLNMTAITFMRCFKCFATRRGTPSRMISDNRKTFKSAARIIKKSLESPEVRSTLISSMSSGNSIWRRHHGGEGYLSVWSSLQNAV